jgi:hypothetical protein
MVLRKALTSSGYLRRPGLLLAEEFKAAEAAKVALMRLFPDADVDLMVEQQPLLLIEDIEIALAELTRCAGTRISPFDVPCKPLLSASSARIAASESDTTSWLACIYCVTGMHFSKRNIASFG